MPGDHLLGWARSLSATLTCVRWASDASEGRFSKLVWVGVWSALALAGCATSGDSVETMAQTSSSTTLVTTTSADPMVPAPASLGVASDELAALLEGEYGPDDPAIAISADGNLVYALAPTELDGRIIADAEAADNGQWFVLVSLTVEGAKALDAMAETYFGHQIALVLDGVVRMAPTINATSFGGEMVVSGMTGPDEAAVIAEMVMASRGEPARFELRPVVFEVPLQVADVEDLMRALENADAQPRRVDP